MSTEDEPSISFGEASADEPNNKKPAARQQEDDEESSAVEALALSSSVPPPAENIVASNSKTVSFLANAQPHRTIAEQQNNEGDGARRARMDKTASQILLETTSRNRKSTIRRHALGHFDLATGRKAVRLQGCRELDAELHAQQGPRSRWQKFRGKFLREERQDNAQHHRRSTLSATKKNDPNAPRYFRLRSVTGGTFNTRRKPFWLCLKPMQYSSWISGYLRWTFRASFGKVAWTSFMLYFSLILFFAACIQLVGEYQPQCFVANEGFRSGKHFMDAFQLSWTTLSTVGYGVISSQVDHGVEDKTDPCLGINAFMAFESFLGVLFGGIVSAIILGKGIVLLLLLLLLLCVLNSWNVPTLHCVKVTFNGALIHLLFLTSLY